MMDSKAPLQNPSVEHTREERQRDIEFANSYRMEYIKHLLTMAAGVFAFTITFMKDYVNKPSRDLGHQWVLVLGWSLLLLSLVAGICHMRCWTSFFTSWGARDHLSDAALRWRSSIEQWRRVAEFFQVMLFLIGLVLMIVFAAVNL